LSIIQLPTQSINAPLSSSISEPYIERNMAGMSHSLI